MNEFQKEADMVDYWFVLYVHMTSYMKDALTYEYDSFTNTTSTTPNSNTKNNVTLKHDLV